MIEGANVGYTLTKGNKYVVSFKYYFISSKVTDQEFSTRGAAEGNIGLANNKTDSLGTYTMSRSNVWQQAYMLLNTNKNNVENYPYLIFLSQLQNEENDLIIYIDDIEIREYDANENVVVKLFVENVTYNNNGVETEIENAYIGAPNLGAVDYNGAMENFFGRLKVEMFYGEKFESFNAFFDDLKKYIHYYNNERISLKLKGMSPVQYRTHSLII